MAYSIDLSGRVALVTGASSGLGTQFAKTLAQAGAAVVLASRRLDRLKDLRSHIEAEGGDAHVVELDVTDVDSIKSAVAHAETETGTLKFTLWKVGIDGGTPVQLTDQLSTWPVVSPDGTRIACWYRETPTASWRIAILPISGGAPNRDYFKIPASEMLLKTSVELFLLRRRTLVRRHH